MRAPHELRPGDVVQLRSGSPDLTVEEIIPAEPACIMCQWFNDTELAHGVFPAPSLKIVRRKDGRGAGGWTQERRRAQAERMRIRRAAGWIGGRKKQVAAE